MIVIDHIAGAFMVTDQRERQMCRDMGKDRRESIYNELHPSTVADHPSDKRRRLTRGSIATTIISNFE